MTVGRLAAVAGGVGAAVYLRARVRRPEWIAPAGCSTHAGPLWVRSLGEGEDAVVLLHGLTGSGRLWDATYDALAFGRRLVVPDLLGFGRSEKPPHGYGPDEHVDALIQALDELDVAGRVVVGTHSLGSVIGLRLAARRPERVAAVACFGPPLYRSAEDARSRIGAGGPMARLFVLPGPMAEAACRWVCDHRSMAGRLAVLTNPSVPPAVASDAVQHTWASYSETMERCLLTSAPPSWLDEIDTPVTLVAGVDDPVIDASFLEKIAADHVNVSAELWRGDHRLPLTNPALCLQHLEEAAFAGGV